MGNVDSLMERLLVDSGDCAIIIAPLLFLYLCFEGVLLFWFRRKMIRANFPAPPIRGKWCPILWTRRLLYARREARVAAAAWYAEKGHLLVIGAAIAIVVSGIWISHRSNNCVDFQRSGALIVLIGFFSIFAGYRHIAALASTMDTLYGGTFVPESQRMPEIDRAQTLSSQWVFIVTALGTLIWGYGDVFLGNLISPALINVCSIP